MECTVGGHRTQHFANGLDSAFPRRVPALHHQRGRAHAHDQAMAAAVEWNGRVLDLLIGGGCAARQKTGAHPIDQVVGGDIVGRDDDDAAAAPGADPVLGQRDPLR
jgi:hypothetical protein